MTNEPGTGYRVSGPGYREQAARSLQPEGELSAQPLVSVVVAARNSASTLPACLQALAAQDHPRTEVIVVDDGSEDDTAAVAESAGVRVVRTPAVGASVARNLGIEVARGEIVAFTDGDCVADPGWARALVEALRSSGATGAGGKQVNVFPPGHALRDGFEAFFRAASIVSDYTRGDERPRVVKHNASCCSAYLVDAVRAIGGFTPGLWPGEDVDLDLRLAAKGGTFYYVPWAIVHHHRPGTFSWFRCMMRRYGAAQRRLVRIHGRKRVIHYLPVLFATGIAMQSLILWPAARGAIIAFDAVLLMGGLGVLGSTTPLRHWPTVMALGLTALWEWHLGWLTARGGTA